MKIAAVVILYHPDELVVKNIASYSSNVQNTLIIDNSEQGEPAITKQLQLLPQTTLWQDASNLGLAIRLNQAAKWAIDQGYEWLLTMDQDSSFEPDAFHRYLNCIKEYPNCENVSMFGVNYISRPNPSENCQQRSVEQLITSGSIINLRNFINTKGFDEALFIDEVDLDFCYQSIQNGLSIIQLESIFLNHQLGTKTEHRSFKSMKKTTRTLHSPFRIYYMVRNFFYVNNKYPGAFKTDKARRKAALINRLKNNLLYNNEKLEVIKAIYKGYTDFKSGRMGKKL